MNAMFRPLPNGALGAHIPEMQSLSTHLRSSIDQLEQVFKGIDSKICSTTWSGNDARGAQTQWNATRQQTMNNLHNILQTMSTAITKQAGQQEATSNI